MGVVIETLVYCDGPRCERKGVPLGNGDNKSEPAYHQLGHSLWVTRQGKHYCEACQEEAHNAIKGKDGE